MFKSFMMAGFECAAPLLRSGHRLDDLAETQHDIHCRADYQLLKELEIETVREGLLWSQIDLGGGMYDFTRFEKIMQVGKDLGVQQIWDLNHFDYPEHLNPFTDEFIESFGRYAVECVRIIRRYENKTIFIVPINEISFYSYVGGTVGIWAPFGTEQGLQLKKQLVRATIVAMQKIRNIDSNVRFINVDPLMVRRTKGVGTVITKSIETGFAEVRYQSLDMLMGKVHPELGGTPDLIDLIGINQYPSSQEWIIDEDAHDTSSYERIEWDDPFWTPLTNIIADVKQRYGKPIIISETGAWGELRLGWWEMFIKQIEDCINMNISLEGVCAYPTIDHRDWREKHMTNSGLWDIEDGDKDYIRIPHQPTIQVIRNFIKSRKESN